MSVRRICTQDARSFPTQVLSHQLRAPSPARPVPKPGAWDAVGQPYLGRTNGVLGPQSTSKLIAAGSGARGAVVDVSLSV